MSEAARAQSHELRPVPPPPSEERPFHEILKSLAGKPVTIVNPESFEEAPVGRQIRAAYYRGKVLGIGLDYVVLHVQMQRGGRGSQAPAGEPVKQYVPLSQIKRVSLRKTEAILHI